MQSLFNKNRCRLENFPNHIKNCKKISPSNKKNYFQLNSKLFQSENTTLELGDQDNNSSSAGSSSKVIKTGVSNNKRSFKQLGFTNYSPITELETEKLHNLMAKVLVYVNN